MTVKRLVARVLLIVLAAPLHSVQLAAETIHGTQSAQPEFDTARLRPKTTQANPGEDSPETTFQLLHHASSGIESRKWSDVINDTNRVLDILAHDHDPESEVQALSLRSDAYAGMREFKLARRDTEKALKINKNIKPANLHLDAMLYGRLLNIAIHEKNLKDGNRFAKKMLKADMENFGDDAAGYLPTLLRGADWYRLSSQFHLERKLLKQGIKLIETAYGETDSRLSEPLRRLAQSCMYDHKDADMGEKALRRAMKLTFSTPAEATRNKIITTTELADHIVVFRDPATASQLYEEAWKLIANDPSGGKDIANRNFNKVLQLYYRMPRSPGEGMGADVYIVEGFTQAEFTVTALGTVEDVTIVDSARGMNSAKFIRAYEKARYRPRIVDGKAVATRNVRHRTIYSSPGLPRNR